MVTRKWLPPGACLPATVCLLPTTLRTLRSIHSGVRTSLFSDADIPGVIRKVHRLRRQYERLVCVLCGLLDHAGRGLDVPIDLLVVGAAFQRICAFLTVKRSAVEALILKLEELLIEKQQEVSVASATRGTDIARVSAAHRSLTQTHKYHSDKSYQRVVGDVRWVVEVVQVRGKG
eukprot:COSAG02_NODE_8_length_60691_cov_104.994752_5_plen_175_part_00